jgi:uncharacterized coiled-coil protein SlyX
VLIAAVCFGVYKYSGNSLPSGGGESLQGESGKPDKRLHEVNQALSEQVGTLQEELRLISAERDRLKEDKAQLLYMVEKLQQQAVQTSVPDPEHGAREKVVRSWLLRISELRNATIPGKAESRDTYVNQVNEVVRGLKEDFAEDAFIMEMGYAKTSPQVKSDIRAAQRKLDLVIKYLRAYRSGAEEPL